MMLDNSFNSMVSASNVMGDEGEYYEMIEDRDLALTLITENCKVCLTNLSFYEAAFIASDSAAKAILQQMCRKDTDESFKLMEQAMKKLYYLILADRWNSGPIQLLVEFIKVILGYDDGQQYRKLEYLFTHNKFGLATVVLAERVQPSRCKSNDYSKRSVMDQYLEIVQDLVFGNINANSNSNYLEMLKVLADKKAEVKKVRGMLRRRYVCCLILKYH